MGNGEKSKHSDNTTRRALLKGIGSVTGVSVVSLSSSTIGGASSLEGQNNTGDRVKSDEEMSSEGDGVHANFLTGSSARFRPYNITDGDNSILNGKWHFSGPMPVNSYQLDVIVEYRNAFEPETVSTNIPRQHVTKDWVKAYNAPIGNGVVYYWQAQTSAVDIFGDQAYIDVEVTPIASGEVTAKVGTYWPGWMFAKATLDVAP